MSGPKSKVTQELTSLSRHVAHLDTMQKRKSHAAGEELEAMPDTSKPSAIFTPTKGRQHTLSIALPGSIIAKYVL